MPAPSVLDRLVASDLVDDPTRSPAAEPLRAEVTARRRRRWGRQASLVAVTLGAVGGFLAISRTIGGEGGSSFDRAVVRWAGRARGPIVDRVALATTFFGSVPAATAISALALWLARRRPRLGLQIVAGACGGLTAELGIKRIFRRTRPTLLTHLEAVSSTSFPSGHAMASASLYLTLAFVASRSRALRLHRAALLGTAGLIASAIGATRVYLGVHWPTDVLGGLALGTAWASTAEAGFDLSGANWVRREAALAPR
jgi:undecaprenyl-diphosphatase